MPTGRRSDVTPADLEVFERSNDLVFAIDEDAVLLYANPRVAEALGVPLDQIEGASIVEFVHPEDLLRAAEVVSALQEDHIGVGVSPAIYRIKRADGEWLPVEITGSQPATTGPFTGWMVMIGRYPGDHDLNMRISDLLTSGAPIGQVLDLIPEFGHWRHPAEPYLVVFGSEDGAPTTVGSATTAALVRDHHGPDSPWSLAIATGEEVQAEPADLPDALRDAAAALGLAGCIAVPVPDPLHEGTAVIVAWSTREGPPLSVHRYPIEQMARALALVMQWRRHIADLERAARYDALTGLTNRASFFDHIESHDFGVDSLLVAVLYVDLDEFKVVNDRFGHAAGDRVLTEVSRRMREVIRDPDVLARLGGDEFAVLCPDLHDTDEAVRVAQRLIDALGAPIDLVDGSVTIGASVGIAVVAATELATDTLIERADEAMYRAKHAGKNRWHLAPVA